MISRHQSSCRDDIKASELLRGTLRKTGNVKKMCHDQFKKRSAARYGALKANQSSSETFANICLAMQQNVCFGEWNWELSSLASNLAALHMLSSPWKWMFITLHPPRGRGILFSLGPIHLLLKCTSNMVKNPGIDMGGGEGGGFLFNHSWREEWLLVPGRSRWSAWSRESHSCQSYDQQYNAMWGYISCQTPFWYRLQYPFLC